MIWNVDPYVSVGQIRFGMSQADVAALLGSEDDRIEHKPGRVIEYRKTAGSPIIRYQGGSVDEITFTRFTQELFFQDKNVFQESAKSFVLLVKRLDPDLRYRGGAIISFKFGISFTGFFPEEESDKAFTIFANGVFDSHRKKSQPFIMPQSDDCCDPREFPGSK